MRKMLLLAVPLLAVLLLAPLAVAVLVAGILGPAAVPAVDCGTGQPSAATGEWRPPFQQRYTLTSGFGRRYHPIYHSWRLHTGQDLASLPAPGPVVAAAGGTVLAAGTHPAYGNLVTLRHPGRVVTRYAHLARIHPKIKTGARVRIGQQLGVEGSTGASTGNHLHFQVEIHGTPTDPVPFLADRGAPLDGRAVAPTQRAASPAVLGLAGDAGEGGIGFDLPDPGSPQQDSLRNPALPIPARVKQLYLAAADRYRLPWTLLAGIGMAETGHGRTTRTSSAGAQGLMQFLPATFAAMGVDGNGDGHADIRNDADSIFSAAHYLTTSGVSQGAAGVRRALYAYNPATWYVNDVLSYAHHYGGGTVLGDPTDCGPGTGNPDLPPIANDRILQVLAWADSHTGDAYRMGATGPHTWDCSSFTQAAYRRIGISMPRTAAAQRSWLAAGNGTRIPPGREKPGDLVFWDSYLGPNQIGHVMIVRTPADQTTIEAHNTTAGVGHFSYATGPRHHIYEIWRVGNTIPGPS